MTKTVTIQAYGTWRSPIHANAVMGKTSLINAQWGLQPNTLVWLESRAGQSILSVQQHDQAPRELNDGEAIRGQVGYGGGEFTVGAEYVIYAAKNGRLMRQSLNADRAVPLTPAFGAPASPVISPDGKWVIYVHHYENVDGLCLVDIDGTQFPRKFAYGSDFVMQPVWHPNGNALAFVTWDIPQMPWDGTTLKLAILEADPQGIPYAKEIIEIAGGEDTAIFQPEFSPDGRTLAYISDADGFSNIYLYDMETSQHRQVTKDTCEYGIPAWIQGMRTYGWSGDGKAIFALRNEPNGYRLLKIDVESGSQTPITTTHDYTHLRDISVSRFNDKIALIASSTVQPERLITVDSKTATIVRRTTGENIASGALAKGQPITWTGHDGDIVHGTFFAPTSQDFAGDGLPPLIVQIHGGPTSQSALNYHAETQFFATRGFAVLRVNHRGSTGYGKRYKDMHRGNWGIYDVEDAASGAVAVASQGMAHPDRRVILGGSAGGYTVLQSLVDKPKFWSAGVCLYGVSNQFTLVSESKFKFETHYSQTLLGALPMFTSLYRERSPLFHAEQIVDPIILFQGEDDEVVLKSQSDSIVSVLEAKGTPHEYHVYANEGHGWRKAETEAAYLTATIAFLDRWVIYR
jgi:dipeptidyl aminopeptidase/acylaminoacyl peptidase